ncbi:SIMPL domain-containing protein [Bradyrhizobium sp. dw_78]|uniref:SIMPL domain-containing protein n=1 Tax=Bradyrhizobium sp. dw_78 TaxID=2719793 RepID=UPI001BD6369F|nr:SIMPL domain-containing protein [Bradyrhizobium sp. dw_78]
MKYRTLLAVITASALLATPALAETDFPPAISVTGEATISVPPDQAQIEAGATSDARTAREASDANNAAMGRLLSALKAANIDEKDIQTSRLSLQPQYAPNHTPPTVTGYRASNHVTVLLRDITKVASTIDVLVGAGATDLGGISFTVSQASKRLDEARAQAITDARRKAEIYARTAGVTLGAPLRISEEGAPVPMFRARMAAAPMATTPVASGEETLSVTVNASWAIKQEK